MAILRGRQLFMNPGPTNIPDRVLRAMDRPAVDFQSAEFKALADGCLERLKRVFRTEQALLAYAGSGHGAWEAALVNLFSPGDRVVILEAGYFSLNWGRYAAALGLEVEVVPFDWRAGPDPEPLEAALRADRGHAIKAVLAVHNETSTGVAAPIPELRRAIDRAGHPALLLVDVISSLACFDFRMDEWGVDVVIAGSQKGLMLPTGMAFTAVSERALEVAQDARMPRVYWDWRRLLTGLRQTSFPGTTPVHFFYGLAEALAMIEEEGLEALFQRHGRLAAATRAAVRHWGGNGTGPELFATDPRTLSDSITAVQLPAGHDADAVRRIAAERFNLSLGGGLDRLAGRVFRIGHMGDLNEPMVLGALATVELALGIAGVPHAPGGVQAALASLAE